MCNASSKTLKSCGCGPSSVAAPNSCAVSVSSATANGTRPSQKGMDMGTNGMPYSRSFATGKHAYAKGTFATCLSLSKMQRPSLAAATSLSASAPQAQKQNTTVSCHMRDTFTLHTSGSDGKERTLCTLPPSSPLWPTVITVHASPSRAPCVRAADSHVAPRVFHGGCTTSCNGNVSSTLGVPFKEFDCDRGEAPALSGNVPFDSLPGRHVVVRSPFAKIERCASMRCPGVLIPAAKSAEGGAK
mmetsp:Transcript_57725/g.160926  ORF Transcript_57725/g.160926 Transcript_57725/m.160926 type:complete len:244 (-) Transcript_57725:263-994(-)